MTFTSHTLRDNGYDEMSLPFCFEEEYFHIVGDLLVSLDWSKLKEHLVGSHL